MKYDINFRTGGQVSAVPHDHESLSEPPKEGWDNYSQEFWENILDFYEDYEEGGDEENCFLIVTNEDGEVYREGFYLRRKSDDDA